MLRRTCRQPWRRARALSTSIQHEATDKAEVLTREFIYGSLYMQDSGYFTTPEREVLHAPEQFINFSDLLGSWDYRRKLAELYTARKEAWLTPVEVFAPYYSHAIAQYMLHSPFCKQRMRIVEVGGGAGTNALHILNYLQSHAPDVYANTTYTLVEISPVMAERQRQRVQQKHPKQCQVINSDMLTYADQHDPINAECFVIALEVLDNLPHDKVVLRNGKWYETTVRLNDSSLEEHIRPVQDPLIQQTMQTFGCELPLKTEYKYNSSMAKTLRRLAGKTDAELTSAFIPTGAMQLLYTLEKSFPRHHVIAADFDQLPPPTLDPTSTIKALNHAKSPTSTSEGSLHAANAPLVASKTTGETKDHDTYLVQGGVADIFFPTDFARLKRAYSTTLNRNASEVSVVKSSAFLSQFADVSKTKTILGYNPLIEDYTNTTFLLS